jgi:hypothetical protein
MIVRENFIMAINDVDNDVELTNKTALIGIRKSVSWSKNKVRKHTSSFNAHLSINSSFGVPLKPERKMPSATADSCLKGEVSPFRVDGPVSRKLARAIETTKIPILRRVHLPFDN